MTFRLHELASTVTYWATNISSSWEKSSWNFWRKDQQNSAGKRKDVWSVNKPCMSTTCLMYKLIWQADETILRDNESLYHPEAAGWRHLWQRADGEKQRVWRTGGYQEVRMLIPFVFKTSMMLVVKQKWNKHACKHSGQYQGQPKWSRLCTVGLSEASKCWYLFSIQQYNIHIW